MLVLMTLLLHMVFVHLNNLPNAASCDYAFKYIAHGCKQHLLGFALGGPIAVRYVDGQSFVHVMR